ncbi:MAG: UDP-N-acetylmuramoyl-L-alanyl-D-glutamate--L-lysine ligase [Enterococcus sp.]
MTFSIEKIRELLIQEKLLKEFVSPDGWHLTIPTSFSTSITKLSYDSRKVDAQTLFFCKGLAFKEDFLVGAVNNGVKVYVSEQPYEVAAVGIIVTDIRKAMAILAMHFYDLPQEKLKIVAYTGTKGKTTAAYFTKAILNEATNKKTALLSTMNTTLDGVTFFKSNLTTPESLDLYQMMATAVSNGMTHLIMEVSSQAYKTNRVYGLQFDVGIFLNISPDHISPIEHPTFDDYFYCKRQLILHSKTMIINHDCDYFDLIQETAELNGVPVITYGRTQAADYLITTDNENSFAFEVTAKKDSQQVAGNYEIQLAGDFNQDNATSAILASAIVGASQSDSQTGLAQARVPGRMEQLAAKNGATMYVDYAHNYLSLKTLLEFAGKKHPDGRVIVVLGSPGGKAISRRQDFGKVLSEHADIAILTADDPAFEDPQKIAAEIQAAITNADLVVQHIMDRTHAIEQALAISKAGDAIVIAGKGQDAYQKVNGEDAPYEGDSNIAKRLAE